MGQDIAPIMGGVFKDYQNRFILDFGKKGSRNTPIMPNLLIVSAAMFSIKE